MTSGKMRVYTHFRAYYSYLHFGCMQFLCIPMYISRPTTLFNTKYC